VKPALSKRLLSCRGAERRLLRINLGYTQLGQRQVESFQLRRQQQVILRIFLFQNTLDYAVRLEGQIDFSPAPQAQGPAMKISSEGARLPLQIKSGATTKRNGNRLAKYVIVLDAPTRSGLTSCCWYASVDRRPGSMGVRDDMVDV